MTRQAWLRRAIARLREAGMDTPELDARLLLCHALGVDRLSLLRDGDAALTEDGAAAADALLRRRFERHEPVARILGCREFWGLDFTLNEATLVPRPDSETLITAALGEIKDRNAALRVLDLGTGTGCLLLALLSECPSARGLGIDQSARAIERAEENALRNDLEFRAKFTAVDWRDFSGGPFDVILCNPPYVRTIDALALDVAAHDPPLALYAGLDGLAAYRTLAPLFKNWLAPDGFITLELGAGQAAAVTDLLVAAGLQVTAIHPDIAGIPRALVARSA